MHQSEGILEKLARVVKGDRLETSKNIPPILSDASAGHRNFGRWRTISYPSVRHDAHQSNYTVELFATRRTRRVLIERWRMTVKQLLVPDTTTTQLRQNVFYQALKSTLHFSTITAILKQEFKVAIQSSERSGDFVISRAFQFSPIIQNLPPAPLDGDCELMVSIESLPRTTVPDVLSILAASADLPHFASTSDCFGLAETATPEPIRPNSIRSPPSKSISLASSKLSVLLDDSGYVDSSNSSFTEDELYSPPSKIARRENSGNGTLRNLLTSPPIERQLKYLPCSTSNNRRSFKFPTIRRNVSRPLLVNFEESILQERLRCVGNLEGFRVDIGAIGSFCPSHLKKNLFVRHFATDEDSLVALPSPYLGIVKLSKDGARAYQIPKSGYLQLTLLNPEGSVVRLFSIAYDFSDMPPSSRTFLRHRTVDKETRKLRYLIQLRALSSSKGTRFYLHGDLKVVFSNNYRTQALGDQAFTSTVEFPTPKYSTIVKQQISNPAVERVKKNLTFEVNLHEKASYRTPNHSSNESSLQIS